MKNKFNKIFIAIFGIMLFYNIGIAQTNNNESNNNEIQREKSLNFHSIQEERSQLWESIPPPDRRGYKQYKRWEYFWEQRTFPDGRFPNLLDVFQEYQSIDKGKNKEFNSTLSSQWKSLGPNVQPLPMGLSQGIGRINVVRFHPNEPNEIWVGTALGGVWRSRNHGQTWEKFPFTQFLSLGVSDIAIAPSNPNVVYVATGDVFGSTSGSNYYTIGMIKTTDAGKTWKVTNLYNQLSDRKLLGRTLIHPENENIVLAASSNGIFKTTDGGETWIQKFSQAFIIDMEFNPNDHNIVYASTYSFGGNGGIYRSTNMGETWTQVYSVSDAVRIALAVTAAEYNYVYALVARRSTNGFHSFLLSLDEGENWETIASSNTGSPNYLGWYGGTGNDTRGQGFYDLCIDVSPTNPDIVFIGGINIWRSTTSGVHFQRMTDWSGSGNRAFVHADIHDLRFSTDGNIVYSTHDGGIDYSTNLGQSWKSISDGLTITQFYKFSNNPHDREVIIGGSQDNGTSLRQSNGIWRHVLGGDGMDCVIDYSDPNKMYASMQNGELRRSLNGGLTFFHMLSSSDTKEPGAWVTPIAIDPQNPNTIYAGYTNVWRSNNNGQNWAKVSSWGGNSTIQNLAVAPSNNMFIYAATYGALYKSSDRGVTWEVILSASQAITDIEVDPYNPERIWTTHSGYSEHYKIQEYNNGVWKNITGNLPNVPVNTVAYQKDSPDRLYVGTDIGVFMSDYNSTYWEEYGDGIPNVIVSDIEVMKDFGILRAATYGRGIWEAPLNFCNKSQPEVELIGKPVICSNESVILRSVVEYPSYLWSNGETTREIEVNQRGTYSLIVMTDDGCNSKSIAFDIEVIPINPIAVTTTKTGICDGEAIDLNASFGFSEYLWSNGETTRRIQVDTPGEYYVIGRNTSGCEVVSEVINVVESASPPTPVIERWTNHLIAPDAIAYQWYYKGNPINGATEKIYVITNNNLGDYQLEVFNEYGCSTISEVFTVVTSVEDEKQSKIAVYPNPNSGKFTLFLPEDISQYTKIEINDLSGQLMHSIPKSEFQSLTELKIDLEHLADGTYFLRLIGGKTVETIKLLKQ